MIPKHVLLIIRIINLIRDNLGREGLMRAQFRILINNFIGSLLTEKIATHVNKIMVFKILKKNIIHRNKVISGTLSLLLSPRYLINWESRGASGGDQTRQEMVDHLWFLGLFQNFFRSKFKGLDEK